MKTMTKKYFKNKRCAFGSLCCGIAMAFTASVAFSSCSDSFLDLYDRAQDSVIEAERSFLEEPFMPADARTLTGGINFSGEPVE